VADGLDLADRVGPGQQVLAALEQFAAEVGAQAVGQHRDRSAVDDLGELPDLALAQELRLVDQHAVQRRGAAMSARAIASGRRRAEDRPSAAGRCARRPCPAEAVVQARGEDERAHAALVVVVRALQQVVVFPAFIAE
jgi:hypothetical protein